MLNVDGDGSLVSFLGADAVEIDSGAFEGGNVVANVDVISINKRLIEELAVDDGEALSLEGIDKGLAVDASVVGADLNSDVGNEFLLHSISVSQDNGDVLLKVVRLLGLFVDLLLELFEGLLVLEINEFGVVGKVVKLVEHFFWVCKCAFEN